MTFVPDQKLGVNIYIYIIIYIYMLFYMSSVFFGLPISWVQSGGPVTTESIVRFDT